MKGKKTGGRKKGTRNKRTVAKQAQIIAAQEAGLSPLDYMLAILRDPKIDDARRMEAAKNAAPYVHPRLAAIEHGGSVEVVGGLGARLNAARARIKQC